MQRAPDEIAVRNKARLGGGNDADIANEGFFRHVAVVRADIESGINLVAKFKVGRRAADERFAGARGGKSVSAPFALELQGGGLGDREDKLLGVRAGSAAELERGQAVAVLGAIRVGGVRVKTGSDHPTNLAVVDGSAPDEFNPRAKDEVAFHLFPKKMELIAPEPHVGPRAGESIFLLHRVVTGGSKRFSGSPMSLSPSNCQILLRESRRSGRKPKTSKRRGRTRILSKRQPEITRPGASGGRASRPAKMPGRIWIHRGTLSRLEARRQALLRTAQAYELSRAVGQRAQSNFAVVPIGRGVRDTAWRGRARLLPRWGWKSGSIGAPGFLVAFWRAGRRMVEANMAREKSSTRETTIGGYLIERLHAQGVRHVFGIPGDYALGFYDQLSKSKLVRVVNTSDEQGAGFAADAYARVRGMGVVCVTYCVGGLKVANSTAGAFAEKSPVVVISGAPGVGEREKNPLLHHKVRDFDTQKKVFEQLTVASTVLSDPQTAFAEIDRVLRAAGRFKQPVYIELPRDMVFAAGVPHHRPRPNREASDPDALRAALEEARSMLNAAARPVFLADVEVHRFGLQDVLLQLVDGTNIPFATTVLGKSVIGEAHPLYLGVYEGALGRDDVRRYVEESDCVVMLGAYLTETNLGVYTARLERSRTIYVNSEKLSISYHNYENVGLGDFMRGLAVSRARRRAAGDYPRPARVRKFRPNPGAAGVTVERLFQRLNAHINENTVVISDVGDALFGATDLFVRHRTEFLGPAYYASMGFAVPASVGAQLANPKLRPLVLVGDGAFQMTGMELSTAARYGLNPVVVVLNNFGYGTERQMQDGPYNDVKRVALQPRPGGAGRGQGVVGQDRSRIGPRAGRGGKMDLVLLPHRGPARPRWTHLARVATVDRAPRR